MRTVTIESNGRIEKTAIYINGEQITGIKELLIAIDEESNFNAIISFEDNIGNVHTKQLFTDDLSSLKRKDPTFSMEDSEYLQSFTIESNGDLQETSLFIKDEFIEGVISILIHIKVDIQDSKTGFLSSIFDKKPKFTNTMFSNEIVFRNPDGTQSIETIF
ncbi:hypothetical protein EBV26_09570 [bacterium]|nr:hypothetical protein [bacterium]